MIPVLWDDCLRGPLSVAVSRPVVTSSWRGMSPALLCRDVPLLLGELPILSLTGLPLLCTLDWLAAVEVVELEVFFTAFFPRMLPADAKGGPCEAAWISEWGDPTIVVGDGVESE